jgi:hypothetical protein
MAFSISGSSFTSFCVEGAVTAFFNMPLIDGLAESFDVDAEGDVLGEAEACGEVGSKNNISSHSLRLQTGVWCPRWSLARGGRERTLELSRFVI